MTPRYVLRRGIGAELSCVHKACLTQLVKHKAINLVVVGSSPIVGV
jgi:hypothetical protein